MEDAGSVSKVGIGNTDQNQSVRPGSGGAVHDFKLTSAVMLLALRKAVMSCKGASLQELC